MKTLTSIFSHSMYDDRERYQYSAYLSESDSDIEGDPDYQAYLASQGGAGAVLAGPWDPRM